MPLLPGLSFRAKYNTCSIRDGPSFPGRELENRQDADYLFLDGVIEIASEAIDTISNITVLRGKDMAKVHSPGKRAFESAIRVLPGLYGQPIINVATIQKWTGFTRAGAQTVIQRFIEPGILRPKDKDKKYGRSYVYREYLDIFTGGD